MPSSLWRDDDFRSLWAGQTASQFGEQASLVVSERVGRENRFRLTPAPMGEAVSWMNSVGAQWDDRLSRLGEHLQSP